MKMTKKGIGKAKTEVVRIHPDDKADLNFIKREMKMSAKYKEGDVIHFLLDIYKSKKIGEESKSGVQSVSDSNLQLTLDHYKDRYTKTLAAVQYWKDTCKIACQKGNLDIDEIMVLVKHE